jgi:hypothetical protein
MRKKCFSNWEYNDYNKEQVSVVKQYSEIDLHCFCNAS